MRESKDSVFEASRDEEHCKSQPKEALLESCELVLVPFQTQPRLERAHEIMGASEADFSGYAN